MLLAYSTFPILPASIRIAHKADGIAVRTRIRFRFSITAIQIKLITHTCIIIYRCPISTNRVCIRDIYTITCSRCR